MNLKFLTPILLTGLFNFSHSQGQVKHHHNSIDEIKNSKALAKFIRPVLDKRYHKWDIADTAMDVKNTLFRKLVSKLKLVPWLKTDVDTDGYTDLLVLIKDTMIEKEPQGRLLTIIKDTGNNNPYLEGEYEASDSTISYYTNIQGRPAIFFYHIDTAILKKIGDTVFYELPQERGVYMAGGFIEYNGNPLTYDIDSISYETSSCYGRCPIFRIAIDKNRHASYEAIRFNRNINDKEITGKFNTKIREGDFNKIKDLLDYINFPALNDHYKDEGSDQQTGTLVINYNNGKIKTIEDYGLWGTAGLGRLYELITALRLNQNWH